MSQSKRQAVEQKRAAYAMSCVNEAKKLKNNGKEYRAYVRNAGATMQNQGLGQAVAFWRAKGDNNYDQLYKDLGGWLDKQMGTGNDLLTWITRASTNEYRLATAEAQAFLIWLKRLAEAELGE